MIALKALDYNLFLSATLGTHEPSPLSSSNSHNLLRTQLKKWLRMAVCLQYMLQAGN